MRCLFILSPSDHSSPNHNRHQQTTSVQTPNWTLSPACLHAPLGSVTSHTENCPCVIQAHRPQSMFYSPAPLARRSKTSALANLNTARANLFQEEGPVRLKIRWPAGECFVRGVRGRIQVKGSEGLQRRPDDDHQLNQRNRTPDVEHGHIRNAEEEAWIIVTPMVVMSIVSQMRWWHHEMAERTIFFVPVG